MRRESIAEQNSHFVAVPPDRDPQPVREFRTFTADLIGWRTGWRSAG